MSKSEDLLKRIPRNYKEVNYLKYIQIMQIPTEPDEANYDVEEYNAYVQYAMLSILLDVSITELTQLPATTIISLLTAINFMNTPIQKTRCDLDIKMIEEITYDEWVAFNKLNADGQQWENMPQILRLLIKNKSDQEIANLSIYDVMQFFFALTRSTLKSLNRFRVCLAWKILKQIVREKIQKIIKMFWHK
ncbi:hypothetical protein [Mucilaginibacter kameinonensis]|uniref:hypothetical protein n=1 Tax=Mucilaginibacter kameinonensis TaxID=452286 RepID=UPI000EF759A6|nr:hypothetical protein [Mucilaginibacter kameinonensis]